MIIFKQNKISIITTPPLIIQPYKNIITYNKRCAPLVNEFLSIVCMGFVQQTTQKSTAYKFPISTFITKLSPISKVIFNAFPSTL